MTAPSRSFFIFIKAEGGFAFLLCGLMKENSKGIVLSMGRQKHALIAFDKHTIVEGVSVSCMKVCLLQRFQKGFCEKSAIMALWYLYGRGRHGVLCVGTEGKKTSSWIERRCLMKNAGSIRHACACMNRVLQKAIRSIGVCDVRIFLPEKNL